MENVPTRGWGTQGVGSLGGTGQNSEETYREEREQHPGGNHDLTLPQRQPDLEKQLLLMLRARGSLSSAGHPMLRTQPSARSQRFRWSGTELASCVRRGPVDAAPGSTQPATWTGPTSPIQRYTLEPALEPSRANETGVECIYFYTATNYQITFYQISYDPTTASC